MYYTIRWNTFNIHILRACQYYSFQINHFHTSWSFPPLPLTLSLSLFLLFWSDVYPVSSLDCACQLVGEFIIENIIFAYSIIMHNNSILAYVTFFSFVISLQTNEQKTTTNWVEGESEGWKGHYLIFFRYAHLVARYSELIVKNGVCFASKGVSSHILTIWFYREKCFNEHTVFRWRIFFHKSSVKSIHMNHYQIESMIGFWLFLCINESI